jgi:hypothetical protein
MLIIAKTWSKQRLGAKFGQALIQSTSSSVEERIRTVAQSENCKFHIRESIRRQIFSPKKHPEFLCKNKKKRRR